MKRKTDSRQRRSSSSCSSNHSCHSCGSPCSALAVTNSARNKLCTKQTVAKSLHCAHYAIVILAACVCYLNGLNGDFVHDDIPAIKLNKDVTAENPLRYLFRNDFWGMPMADQNSHKSYRPLTTLTFRWNHVWFGSNPISFHVTNVALHVTASVLFLQVCYNVAGLNEPFSTLAALLFAVHPIHTEAVTGIVGRADVLAAVFFLLSLLTYHRHYSCKSNAIWISIMFGTCSTFAKETGFMIFLVNISLDFAKSAPYLFKSIVKLRLTNTSCEFMKRVFKTLISCLILLSFRIWMLDGSLPKFSIQDNPAAFHPSIFVRLLTYCYLSAFNFVLLLCPGNLSHDWQMGSIPLITSTYDFRNLLTISCFGFLAVLLLQAISSIKENIKIPIVLGSIMLIVPFLPASNIIVTVGFVVAERILYMPSMGFILLLVYGIQLLSLTFVKHRQSIVFLTLLIFIAGSFRTVIRNCDWSSRESLLKSGLKALPLNAKMHYNFANFLRDSSKTDLAIVYYRQALKLWPTYASAYNNLGTLMTNFESAEQNFLTAINFAENHLNAHYNLGVLYRKANRSYHSEVMLRKCLEIERTFVPALLELTKLPRLSRREINEIFQNVVRLKPNNFEYLISYGNWLQNQRLTAMALVYYWKITTINSSYQMAYIAACVALRERGQLGRLLLLIIRMQMIKNYNEFNNNLPKYDQVWRIKSELLIKAKAYDSTSNFVLRKLSTSGDVTKCHCLLTKKLNLTKKCNNNCHQENRIVFSRLIDVV